MRIQFKPRMACKLAKRKKLKLAKKWTMGLKRKEMGKEECSSGIACKIEQTQCLSQGLSGFVMVIFWRTINKVFRPQSFQLELAATKFKGISVVRPFTSSPPQVAVDTNFFPQKIFQNKGRKCLKIVLN